MTQKENEIFRFLIAQYKDQWDRCEYFRTGYDEDLEYYMGYRAPDQYPLAYNKVFNRILPIIHTLLSRFMDQMYQTSNIVSVKPRKRQDVERAKKVEGVLNFQLENLNDIDSQGGSYLTMFKWFFNTLSWGKGITKAYWRKEERISPSRSMLQQPSFDRMGNFQGWDNIDVINQEMQTVYDGPYVEVLHPKLFVPHPQYKSIQQMPAAFLVYKRSMDYVKRQADKGIYKNVNELGWESTSHASHNVKDSDEAFLAQLNIEGALQRAELEDTRKTKEIDILECYAKVILNDAPYEVSSGVKIKGKEEEVVVHIGNYKTILSLQKNKYATRPLFDMGCYMSPEMYWDLGLIKLTKGLQESIDTLENLRLQNVTMMINQMLKVRADADIPPESLVWKPFGIIPVEEMTDIEPLTIPDFHSNLFTEQENFYEKTIQDLTGMYSWNMGQTPQRTERVGVVQSISSMGEARAKLMLMSMDYLGIRPLLKFIMTLNAFHLPSGFEYRITSQDQQQFGKVFGDDLHPNFDFAARYTAMEPALGKQFRAQQLLQMAQLWQQNPWINQYQFTKVLMELLDIRESESLMKDPKQFMQEIEQRQKSEMMARQMETQFKTQGKLKESQQDFQEEMMLNEQTFGHDMALRVVENELESDQEST